MITEEFLAPMALTQGQFWLDIAPTPGLKGPGRQDLPSACDAVKFDGVNPTR